MGAMNREEVEYGCSQEGEEVEIQEEGEEGRRKEENRREALRAEKEVRCKKEEVRAQEKSSGHEEAGAEEEGRTEEESRATKARTADGRAGSGPCTRRARTGSVSEPGHLSPVQPTGGRRQSG